MLKYPLAELKTHQAVSEIQLETDDDYEGEEHHSNSSVEAGELN
jgi:hypothetical protein